MKVVALTFAFIVTLLFGFTLGQLKEREDTIAAWDDITVVADGTLIANPSAYAFNPEELADHDNVRIINNRKAAIDVAFNEDK